MIAGTRGIVLFAIALFASGTSAQDASTVPRAESGHNVMTVTMQKNPGCGCCDLWADHLRQHGFEVEITENPQLLDLKQSSGIPRALHSCHTAFAGKFFVEGHVPAQDILKLLKLNPDKVAGIAVPGMPLGSPGMEHPRPQSFNTIAVSENGDAYVFARHPAGEDFSQEKPEKD